MSYFVATMMDSSPESGQNVAAYSPNKVAPGLGGVGKFYFLYQSVCLTV